jgi:hypothetical protein
MCFALISREKIGKKAIFGGGPQCMALNEAIIEVKEGHVKRSCQTLVA